MYIDCIFLLILMLAVTVFHIQARNTKGNKINYNKRKVGLNYIEAVQLPMIGSNTTRQHFS